MSCNLAPTRAATASAQPKNAPQLTTLPRSCLPRSYFFDKSSVQNGGNRYATVLTYLSDVEEGGETVFPNIPAPGGDNGPTYTECARKFLAAKPRKGDAVLFHSIKPNGDLERRSLHTACPVSCWKQTRGMDRSGGCGIDVWV